MVYGEGVFDGEVDSNHPAYVKWMAMLGRCYSPHHQKRDPSYTGVTVCEDWKLFSNFYTWLQSWDGWEALEIDKDVIGGRIYSPKTCLMISGDLNKFLAYRKRPGKLVGCYYERDRNKWKASIKVPNEKHKNYAKTLGRFETELDAHLCWLSEKIKYLMRFYETEDARVVPHLKSMVSKMEYHLSNKKVLV